MKTSDLKIVFLCGSLEPGRDGVGDYTRLLALEVIRQGNKCWIISLNDRFLTEPKYDTQLLGEDTIEVLRLPHILKTKKRFELANSWIEKLNPDWISLQFVIFSFHSRGIPFGIIKALAKLRLRRKWHFMFHELWVGISEGASKKHILWGALQRYIVQTLISRLRPEIISTQSKLYLQILRKSQHTVHHLPLFSNVPKYGLRNESLKYCCKEKGEVSMVVFGTIHPFSRLQTLMDEVDQFIRVHNKKVCLTLVGRCGTEVNLWRDVWKERGFPFIELGEQPLEVISTVLSASEIGISTSALYMTDKSGTVAAMIEHNLPIICIGQVWRPRGLKPPVLPPNVFDVSTKGCIALSLNHVVTQDNARTLSGVARNFINTLETLEIS